MIRPDCVALLRPPQRTVQYASGGLLSRALSGRPWRRFVTTWCEKVGLERLFGIGALRRLPHSGLLILPSIFFSPPLNFLGFLAS